MHFFYSFIMCFRTFTKSSFVFDFALSFSALSMQKIEEKCSKGFRLGNIVIKFESLNGSCLFVCFFSTLNNHKKGNFMFP